MAGKGNFKKKNVKDTFLYFYRHHFNGNEYRLLIFSCKCAIKMLKKCFVKVVATEAVCKEWNYLLYSDH